MSSAWGPSFPRAALLLGLWLLASTAVRGREAETLSSSEAVGAASPNSSAACTAGLVRDIMAAVQAAAKCVGPGRSAQRSPGCMAHSHATSVALTKPLYTCKMHACMQCDGSGESVHECGQCHRRVPGAVLEPA